MKNRTKSNRNIFYLVLFMLLCFTSINLLSEPEIIHNKNTDNYRYSPRYKYLSIGNITYFSSIYNDDFAKMPLYQTDATAKNTHKVIAKDLNNIDIELLNPIQMYSNNNNLILSNKHDNMVYLSLLDVKQNRVYNVDSLPSTINYGFLVYNLDSANSIIYYAYGYNTKEYIYKLDLINKKLLPYNYPMKYSVELIENDKLILKDMLNGIHLISPNNFIELWSLDSTKLNNFLIFFFSKGIYLLNKDVTKNSLFVAYKDGVVDTVETKELPKNSKVINLEYGICSVYDSTSSTSSLIRIDSNFKIIDTLSLNYNSIIRNDNFLLFFKIGKTITTTSENEIIFLDLYSFNYKTKKTEKLVPDCLFPERSPNFRFTLKDGRIIFPLQTFKNGLELFISDGTSFGTKMIRDINSGPLNALSLDYYHHIPNGQDDNYFYFEAFNPDYGRSIWQTDGTEEGTIPIFSFDPSETNIGLDIEQFYVNNHKLIFETQDNVYANEIKKIDKITKFQNDKIIDIIFGRDAYQITYSKFDYISLLKDKENNIFIGGTHYFGNKNTLCYSNDLTCDTIKREFPTIGFMIKYNDKGERLFTKYINQYKVENFALAIDSSLNLYNLSSRYLSYGLEKNFLSINKYNNQGDSIWNIKLYIDEKIGKNICLETDKNNNVFALFSLYGYRLYNDNFSLSTNNSPQYIIIKISKDGEILNSYKFSDKQPFAKYLMTIINDHIYVAQTSTSELNWSPCKLNDFPNSINKFDLDLNLIKKSTFVGNDFNYIASIQKGFGNDILIAGTYRAELNLLGFKINSDVEIGDCNIQTSYIAIMDEDLNIRNIKNMNPIKYVISSISLTDDNNILTVGTCENCLIDTLNYPYWKIYQDYELSMSVRRFDYWGNEISSFLYAKNYEWNYNLRQPKIININNMPLICDIYDNSIDYLPEIPPAYGLDHLLLFKTSLFPNAKQNVNISTKYSINNDYFGNSFIKQYWNVKPNEIIEVSFYDLLGKLIESKSVILINGIQQIDLQNKFSKGVYIITIKDDDVVEQHKFLK